MFYFYCFAKLKLSRDVFAGFFDEELRNAFAHGKVFEPPKKRKGMKEGKWSLLGRAVGREILADYLFRRCVVLDALGGEVQGKQKMTLAAVVSRCATDLVRYECNAADLEQQDAEEMMDKKRLGYIRDLSRLAAITLGKDSLKLLTQWKLSTWESWTWQGRRNRLSAMAYLGSAQLVQQVKNKHLQGTSDTESLGEADFFGDPLDAALIGGNAEIFFNLKLVDNEDSRYYYMDMDRNRLLSTAILWGATRPFYHLLAEDDSFAAHPPSGRSSFPFEYTPQVIWKCLASAAQVGDMAAIKTLMAKRNMGFQWTRGIPDETRIDKGLGNTIADLLLAVGAYYGQEEIVRCGLENGGRLTKTERVGICKCQGHALKLAARAGRLDVVLLLLAAILERKGIHTNVSCEKVVKSALAEAAKHGWTRVFEALWRLWQAREYWRVSEDNVVVVSKGGEQEDLWQYLLVAAATGKHDGVIRCLLEHQGVTNLVVGQRQDRGISALCKAIAREQDWVVRRLVFAGVDVNMVIPVEKHGLVGDKFGEREVIGVTTLQLARSERMEAVLRELGARETV